MCIKTDSHAKGVVTGHDNVSWRPHFSLAYSLYVCLSTNSSESWRSLATVRVVDKMGHREEKRREEAAACNNNADAFFFWPKFQVFLLWLRYCLFVVVIVVVVAIFLLSVVFFHSLSLSLSLSISVARARVLFETIR